MPKLFGQQYSRDELLRKVGSVDQLGGVRQITLADGKARASRAVEFRTGTGLCFTAVADRALDICSAAYCGASLCWEAPCGVVHPAYYEPEGLGWLRSFFGGLLVTCGMTWLGAPHDDPDGGVEAHSGLGLHGRITHIPAQNLYVDGAWEGDEYTMWAQGKMRETMIFGPNLLLERRVWSRLGENRIWLDDEVTNEGFRDQEHMLMYHCNIGFPVADEHSEYLFASEEVIAPREWDAQHVEHWAEFAAPNPDQEELAYYHRLRGNPDGTTYVAFVNRKFNGGQGLGLYFKFNLEQMPWLLQWKMPGAQSYVTGIEPATGQGGDRPGERKSGRMITIAPQQSRNYNLEIGVLTNQAEIGEIEDIISDL
ncbi:MAG: aldose 1-epimerase family protein [Armatimonadetes bacterium]|nr:aldose 1-epimerase family protein [Armatimonadota bacterium]